MLHKQTSPAFGFIPFLLGWLGLTVLVMMLSLSSCRKQPRLVWPITPPTSIDLAQYEDVSKNIQRLEQITNKPNQLDSILIWVEWLRNSNDSLAFLYAEAAYERATKNRYEKAQAVSAYYMALLPGRQALYSESIEISLLRADISRRIFMRGQDLAWKIKINNLLGNLWYRNQVSGATNLDSANYYLKTALELAETDQQDQVLEALRGEVYHNLWSVQVKQKNTSQAQESFQQAYQLYENSEHQFAQDRQIKAVNLTIVLGSI